MCSGPLVSLAAQLKTFRGRSVLATCTAADGKCHDLLLLLLLLLPWLLLPNSCMGLFKPSMKAALKACINTADEEATVAARFRNAAVV